MTNAEPMFSRGILSLPDAAQQAQRSISSFRRLARNQRLPFRVIRDPAGWAVDGGSFHDWLSTQTPADHTIAEVRNRS